MAISNAAADALSRWPISRDRIHVCHTVIDFESVIHEVGQTPKSTTQQSHSKFKVLLPAQLLAEKGQQVAVEAARILKQQGIEFEMWLAGDVKMGVENTFIDGLKQSIESYGLQDEVKLLGHRSDVRALMTQADVVILPSRTEGFPRSIWEAMILRCPVIATPAGGILDLVIDGQTGLLISMDDAESLATGIMQLIEHPDLAKELTENAYRYVTTTYSQDKTLSRIEETLLTACAR